MTLFCIKTNIRRLWRKVNSIWTIEYPNLRRKLKLKRSKARKELRLEWRGSCMSRVHKGSKNQRLETIHIKGLLLERTKRILDLILLIKTKKMLNQVERAKRKKIRKAQTQEARTPRAPDSHRPPSSPPSPRRASTWSKKANAKSSTTTMAYAARNWRRATSSENQKLSRASASPSLETSSQPRQSNASSSPKMNSWRFPPTKRIKSSSMPNKEPTSRG